MKKPDAAYTEFNIIFSEAVKETTVTVPRHLFKMLFAHWVLLNEWNEKMNLTKITDMRQAIARHYVDSLALLPVLGDTTNVMDVGSGAGFPGVVLAISREKMPVTLVESVEKKAHFLKEVRRSMALENITVVNARVENIKTDFRFDLVTGRAVAKPKQFAKLIKNRVTPNGRMAIFIKGFEPPELSGWQAADCHQYRLPYGGEKRAIVTYRLE